MLCATGLDLGQTSIVKLIPVNSVPQFAANSRHFMAVISR